MTLDTRKLAAFSIVTLALIGATLKPAGAVYCLHLIQHMNEPSYLASVSEIDGEILKVAKPKQISVRTVIEHDGQDVYTHFPDVAGTGESEILAYSGPGMDMRPDLNAVEGYVKPGAPKESFEEPKLFSTHQTGIVLRTPGEPDVFLPRPSATQLAAVARLEKHQFLAAAVVEEKAVGFDLKNSQRPRAYVVELYYFEPNAMSLVTFAVKANTKSPMIRFVQTARKETYLTIDSQTFKVDVKPTSK